MSQAHPPFFRLLTNHNYKGFAKHPSVVPWDLVEPYRDQALKNHNQTLERLNERGGLCVQELKSLLTRTKYPKEDSSLSFEQACIWLDDVLNETKLKSKSERTGILSVLEYEIEFPALLLTLAHNEEKNKTWLFQNKKAIMIDTHEFIIQSCFEDPYFKEIYNYFDELLSYQWKTSSHIKLTLK